MTASNEKTLQLFGFDIDATVKAGRRLRVDNWGDMTTGLVECEYPELAEFRIPSVRYEGVALAANVRVTGRKPVKISRAEGFWVRVEIEFVGDGEPSTFHGAYMLVRD